MKIFILYFFIAKEDCDGIDTDWDWDSSSSEDSSLSEDEYGYTKEEKKLMDEILKTEELKESEIKTTADLTLASKYVQSNVPRSKSEKEIMKGGLETGHLGISKVGNDLETVKGRQIPHQDIIGKYRNKRKNKKYQKTLIFLTDS